MAHARQVERALPQFPTYSVTAIAAALAALLIAAILAFGALDPFGQRAPTVHTPNPALLDAEARWELHRKLQSGDVDPLTRAQREWERQRLQQSLAFD